MKGEYNEKIEYYEKALNEAHNSLTFIGFKGLNEELFEFAKKQNSSLVICQVRSYS